MSMIDLDDPKSAEKWQQFLSVAVDKAVDRAVDKAVDKAFDKASNKALSKEELSGVVITALKSEEGFAAINAVLDASQLSKDVSAIRTMVEASLQGTHQSEGRKNSIRFGVAIVLNGQLVCHGLFVLLYKTDEQPKVYFLTATHCGFDLCGFTFTAVFPGGDTYEKTEMEVRFSSEIFLDPEYVKTGDRDICLVEVDLIGAGDELDFKIVQIANKNQLKQGQIIEAQGFIHCLGRIVTAEGLSEDGFRMLVDSVSAPGASGQGFFSTSGLYVGPLHGISKHRKHTGRLPDNATGAVYIDGMLTSQYTPVSVKSGGPDDESEDTWLDVLKKPEGYHGSLGILGMSKGSHDQDNAIEQDVALIRKLAGKVGYLFARWEELNLQKGENLEEKFVADRSDREVLEERQGIWDEVMKRLSTKALDPVSQPAFPRLRNATYLLFATPFDEVAVGDEEEQPQPHESQQEGGGANVVPESPPKQPTSS